MRAPFMPKPFSTLTGNGCHAHVSVWGKTCQNNLFEDSSDEMGLSTMAYHFLGGVLQNAQAITSIFNPTVNSYKRIDAQVTTSGSTWSPNAVAYGGNNRTHMVRIPDRGRFELRLMDGAANPYLMQAGVLEAGLDGVEYERDPGKRLDINMYTEGHKLRGLRRLTANSLDAIRSFEKRKVLRSGRGDALVDS